MTSGMRRSDKRNLLSFLGFCFFIVLALGSGNTTTTKPASNSGATASSEPSVAKTGESFQVGYFSYVVNDSWYTNRLSKNPYLNQAPDATYLFVDLTVRNDDKSSSTVPPFKLIDENGAEYDTSQKAWAGEGSIGLLTSLNPGVAKRAYVIFDVPTNHKYKLNVSGGFLSAAKALVELNPSIKK